MRFLFVTFCFIWSSHAFCDEADSVVDLLNKDGWVVHSGSCEFDWIPLKIESHGSQGKDSVSAIALTDCSEKKLNAEALAKLRHVHVIVDFSGLTDDQCLASINPNAPLTVLLVPRSQITDKGIRSITKFAGLQHLDLYGTALTNDAVDSLLKLKYLRSLNIHSTKISKQNVERIRRELPFCRMLNFDWNF